MLKKKSIFLTVLIITGLFLGFSQVCYSYTPGPFYNKCSVEFFESVDYNDGWYLHDGYFKVYGYDWIPQMSYISNLGFDANCRGMKIDWKDEISSLKVGPHTWVVLFEEERYGGDSVALGPNVMVKDIAELNLDKINSVKIFNVIPEEYKNMDWHCSCEMGEKCDLCYPHK